MQIQVPSGQGLQADLDRLGSKFQVLISNIRDRCPLCGEINCTVRRGPGLETGHSRRPASGVTGERRADSAGNGFPGPANSFLQFPNVDPGTRSFFVDPDLPGWWNCLRKLRFFVYRRSRAVPLITEVSAVRPERGHLHIR